MEEKETLEAFANYVRESGMLRQRRARLSPKWASLGFSFIGQGDYMVVFRYREMAIKIPRRSTHNIEEEATRLLALQSWASYENYIGHDRQWLATNFIEGGRLDKLREQGRLTVSDSAILELEVDLRHSMIATPYLPWDLKPFNLIQTTDGQLKVIDTGEFINLSTVPPSQHKQVFQASLKGISRLIMFLSNYAPTRP